MFINLKFDLFYPLQGKKQSFFVFSQVKYIEERLTCLQYANVAIKNFVTFLTMWKNNFIDYQ